MVNVITTNGKFIITESLLNRIKENNPEILLEKKTTNKTFIKQQVDAHNKDASDKEKNRKVKEILKLIDKGELSAPFQPDDFKITSANNNSKSVDDDLILIDDSTKELIKNDIIERIRNDRDYEQFIKNDKKDFDSVRNNVINYFKEKYSKYNIDDWLSTDEETMKDINTEIRFKTDDEYKEKYGNAVKSIYDYSNNKSQSKDFSNELYNNKDLMKELQKEMTMVSNASRRILKRIQHIINVTLGIMGGINYSPRIFTDEEISNTFGNSDDSDNSDAFDEFNALNNSKKSNNVNHVNSDIIGKHNLTRKTINGINSEVPKLISRTPESYTGKLYKYNLLEDNSISKMAGNEIKMALGGFKITPSISEDDINSNTFGKALKYYLGELDDVSSTMLIKIVFNEILKIKNDKTKGDEENIDKKASEKVERFFNQENKNELLSLGIKYLSNVSYSIIINNPSKFQQIVDVIRYDTRLKEDFDVKNSNAVKQLNTRETVIVFKDKNTKIPVLILTCVPFFARGRELIKNLKPGWDSLRRLKA